MWSWASYFNAPGHPFLICKVGRVIATTACVILRTAWCLGHVNARHTRTHISLSESCSPVLAPPGLLRPLNGRVTEGSESTSEDLAFELRSEDRGS